MSLLEQADPESHPAKLIEVVTEHLCMLWPSSKASLYLLELNDPRLWTVTPEGYEWQPMSSTLGQVATSNKGALSVGGKLYSPVLNGQGEAIAVLMVQREQIGFSGSSTATESAGCFTPDDEAVLVVFCSAVAVLLRGRELHKAHQAEVAEWHQLAERIGNNLEGRQTQLVMLMKSVRDVLRSERGAIFLADYEKGEMLSSVALDSPPIRAKMDHSIAGHVAMTGKLANVPAVSDDGRFGREAAKSTGFDTRNVLCAPIRNRAGDVLGVVQVMASKKGSISPLSTPAQLTQSYPIKSKPAQPSQPCPIASQPSLPHPTASHPSSSHPTPPLFAPFHHILPHPFTLTPIAPQSNANHPIQNSHPTLTRSSPSHLSLSAPLSPTAP